MKLCRGHENEIRKNQKWSEHVEPENNFDLLSKFYRKSKYFIIVRFDADRYENLYKTNKSSQFCAHYTSKMFRNCSIRYKHLYNATRVDQL